MARHHRTLEIIQLDAVSLESVTPKTLQLQAQNKAQDRFKREAELLDIIFYKKPLVFRCRFDHLNKKHRAFKLILEEHHELLRFIEESLDRRNLFDYKTTSLAGKGR